MEACYQIDDARQIISPALVVFRDLVAQNLDKMIAIARDPARLRPHCKTHKMREVIEMQLAWGIGKHKCATFAEAEMLAEAGVKDIFLAYNLVGPNIARAVAFRKKYPGVVFSVTADSSQPIAELSAVMDGAGQSIEVLLDIDTGQHRTGVEAGPQAEKLYAQISQSQGLVAGGLHVYDGQNHQTDIAERRAAVDRGWERVLALRDKLLAAGLPVPRIVAGGTGSFPVYAAKEEAALELSPGTCIFHDFGYGRRFPDLDFTPAALLLTRVISRPSDNRVTFDLGYKACASDPPAGERLLFPDIPDAREVLQNEEHLVIETSRAADFAPGDIAVAIPRHICPTSALHKEVFVVAGGKLVDRWRVAARDRWLTV